jgi:hypothetical protein
MNLKLCSNLNRRDFLKILAAVGLATVAGNVLAFYAPWLDADETARHTRRPLDKQGPPSAQMREIIRYSTLAASGHNTQPWLFSVQENAIDIHPDYTRSLSAVDPDRRELWISLGCALENLLVAARATGYEPEVTYPDSADVIRVRLRSNTTQSSALFDAIPLRQNTRSAFDGQPIKRADLDRVREMPLEPGIALQFVTRPADLEKVLEYVNQGNLIQQADRAFVDELIVWLRFNKQEALASKDGLYLHCLGSPLLPRWLGGLFVATTKPQKQADVDAKKLRSSSGAVVVASDSESKTAWVRTGQVYERMALMMTAVNIKSAFLNQPIEVTPLRGQFQSAMGLGPVHPQLLVRFGYADPMPNSFRRPVERVLTAEMVTVTVNLAT